MEIELSSEQTLLLSSLDRLLAKYRHVPADRAGYVPYSPELQNELCEGGFLGVAFQEGYGLLDAALIVENVARVPWGVETAASALVSYALGRELKGPVALCEGINRPTRYLPVARHAFVLSSDGVWLAELDRGEIQDIESVVAYPVGTLTTMPPHSELLGEKISSDVRSLWQIAIAAEAAGLMRGALDTAVSYVKERRQFGRPLSDFQAVQHRLACDEQIVSASLLLAMRAAQGLRAEEAATAALYVQQQMRSIIYDCHQFTGAMGVTLEYPLHSWTYRLKFIQGELGGFTAQAAAVADLIWQK